MFCVCLLALCEFCCNILIIVWCLGLLAAGLLGLLFAALYLVWVFVVGDCFWVFVGWW